MLDGGSNHVCDAHATLGDAEGARCTGQSRRQPGCVLHEQTIGVLLHADPPEQSSQHAWYRGLNIAGRRVFNDYQNFSWIIDSILLPNGTSYKFTYEPVSGGPLTPLTTGRIQSITLPTGGVISYAYGQTDCASYSSSIRA
jgi:hypothetical protein